jgi:hypothetical protein
VKLLFLDIDGVANSTGSCLARTGERWIVPLIDNTNSKLLPMIGGEYGYGVTQTFDTIDPTAVELINRLVKKSGCHVVLSSSHRSFFVGSNYQSDFEFGTPGHIIALNLYLRLLGFDFELFGITPRLYGQRGAEVQFYVESLAANGAIIDEYVIIDDGGDFLSWQPLVRTDATIGFTGKDYFKAAQLLGTDESGIIV